MKLVILWCALFCFQAMAQRELPPGVFKSVARPQLSGIINEFYQMIEQFPDFPKDMNHLINTSKQFEDDRQLIIQTCPRYINDFCLSTIERMLKGVQELDLLTTTFYGFLKSNNEPYISALTGLRFIDLYQNELLKLKSALEFASFTYRAKKSQIKTDPILLLHDRMKTYLSLSVPEFTPYIYNFIRPLEHHLSTPTAHTFFYKNLKELNFSLNLLHQNLTKRSKKTPQGMSGSLNNMHMRWNLIQRAYY
jgi:hypothetical protein